MVIAYSAGFGALAHFAGRRLDRQGDRADRVGERFGAAGGETVGLRQLVGLVLTRFGVGLAVRGRGPEWTIAAGTASL